MIARGQTEAQLYEMGVLLLKSGVFDAAEKLSWMNRFTEQEAVGSEVISARIIASVAEEVDTKNNQQRLF